MTSRKSQQTRQTRTDSELRAASRALLYEIWMLNEMVKSLAVPAATNSPHHNALVEAFVLHARNVIEFFYAKTTVHSDTVVASDFSTGWKKNIPDWLDKVRERANKLLAHLTYDRVLKL